MVSQRTCTTRVDSRYREIRRNRWMSCVRIPDVLRKRKSLTRKNAVRELASSRPRNQLDSHVWKLMHANVDETQMKTEHRPKGDEHVARNTGFGHDVEVATTTSSVRAEENASRKKRPREPRVRFHSDMVVHVEQFGFCTKSIPIATSTSPTAMIQTSSSLMRSFTINCGSSHFFRTDDFRGTNQCSNRDGRDCLGARC